MPGSQGNLSGERAQRRRRLASRAAVAAGAAAWAGSWYLMYLEINRWHHVKPSLAFNSDPVTADGIRPRPGLPLIMVYIACFTTPPLVVLGLARRGRQFVQPRRSRNHRSV